MARQYWQPSNLLNPVPAVMISCCDEKGKANVMTAAFGRDDLFRPCDGFCVHP